MRTIFFLFLVLLASCTQEVLQRVPGYYSSARSPTDNWTFLNLSYGDIGVTFTNNQVACFNNRYADTADHSFLLYSDDGTYELAITIKTDSLVPGNYYIDARNGSVEVFQYGRIQIGIMQPSSFLSMSLSADDKRELDGNYSGLLTNPYTGRQVQITGSITNLFVPQ